jgi:glycosyltransferase involved in cell wall biosynthesis
VEALYAGLPVIATAIGGAQEIVDDSCGRLVRSGDAGALRDALGELMGCTGMRQRLGSQGPARARALCDPEKQLLRMQAVLNNSFELSADGCEGSEIAGALVS